jgi:UDP-3-O-[3-hydroxymyristoyl] glucosamine N-acyltransferase
LERIVCAARFQNDARLRRNFIDPKNAYISEQASIGRDTIIYPNVAIEAETVIGDGCTIRAERA